jgi:hypothetical protein
MGKSAFSNQDSYEGMYRFDLRHGRGIYRYHDGRVYDGHFVEDKRHGWGIFSWPDGSLYHGDFVRGQREGRGTYTFCRDANESVGGRYEGSWKDGRYHGFGKCVWEDGRLYQGEWKDGQAHGRGIEIDPKGKIRHTGLWRNNEPVNQ